MLDRETILSVVLVVALLVGGTAPAGASAPGDRVDTTDSASVESRSAALPANATNNTSVNVTVGQQLSTVLTVTEEEVESEVEETAFSIAVETENESAEAEAIADRAEGLRERATDIHEDYREATAAFSEGEMDRSRYAQRLATLNARARNVVTGYERLQRYAANVSAVKLRAAGYEPAQTRMAVERLDAVTGAGVSALLQRFSGESEATVSVETEGGLSISVVSATGERSREFERTGDNSTNISVDQSSALETARGALSEANGTWVLTESSIDTDDGTYHFVFRLDSNRTTGEAEVTVDGSSGTVVTLEEEIEEVDDEGRDEERDVDEAEGEEQRENETEEEREDVVILVESGTPAPNATVTLRVLAGGESVSGAAVSVNGKRVGTTGADGTISLTLPSDGDVTVTAVHNESEGELEFEFGEDEAEEVERNLNVTGTYDNGTVSLQVNYNGTPVADAAVYANGERVGVTGADGALSFETNATEELELEIVKGEFEATLRFAITDGTLVQEETEVEGGEDEADESDGTDETDGTDEDDETTETETGDE